MHRLINFRLVLALQPLTSTGTTDSLNRESASRMSFTSEVSSYKFPALCIDDKGLKLRVGTLYILF
jgi:hypothetical protein